jgi:hypothetical protein
MPSRTRQILLLAAFACTPVFAAAQLPVGELYSTLARVRGSVNLDSGGTTILSGSSIDSGEQPARLALRRGGELDVCQRTSVAVSASANGRDLMFSFGSGTIQSRYKIAASSDVIVTPDLRFVITGPGEFDLDIGIAPDGDTCIHSYSESTGGVIVNQQMEDGSYQVKPSDFVVFRKGKLTDVDTAPTGSCGCPHPKETYVARAPEPPPAPVRIQPTQSQPTAAVNAPPVQPASPSEHAVVDAPFVFDASGGPPPLTARVMRLRMESKPYPGLAPAVQPPSRKSNKVAKTSVAGTGVDKNGKPLKKGFWHRLGRALFG